MSTKKRSTRRYDGAPTADTKTYACLHVIEKTRPILYVTRPEGDWCILCGDNHPENEAYLRVIGMGHAIEYDPTLLEILDLLPNEEAERSKVGGQWVRSASEATDSLRG